ncbi:MAG TPA: 2-oxo acid dehydrogenase subunit E2, partial [Solirubrobacteraceae bacterium]|nr:2-oxo acid dehydrogenase subunit E2 [Solirubrobacteraceae bacterium]
MSAQPQDGGTATAKGEVSVEELSRGGRSLARRVAETKATVPEHTLSVEVDMEACASLRGDPVPTYMDMVVRACALSLREHPRANGAYRDGHLEAYSRVNVGLAVHGPGVLTVPTVFDADQHSLAEIAATTRGLAERVDQGTITSSELGGATFTVSGLGVRAFTAILTPPQAGVLAVGAVEPRAVVHEGELAARRRLDLTLTCDHRILFGADAAAF